MQLSQEAQMGHGAREPKAKISIAYEIVITPYAYNYTDFGGIVKKSLHLYQTFAASTHKY